MQEISLGTKVLVGTIFLPFPRLDSQILVGDSSNMLHLPFSKECPSPAFPSRSAPFNLPARRGTPPKWLLPNQTR